MGAKLDAPVRYTSEQVCQLANISYRQLDYWVRLRHLHPRNARYGSGHGRVWTHEEAVKAVAIARMLDDGIVLWKAAELVARGHYAMLAEQLLPEGEEALPTESGRDG
jgi:DNA-binding transcriptional MerR regulator